MTSFATTASVPFALGERPQLLRIRRLGDQVEVARVGAPA
jgi:hypothetical protein